MSSKTAAKTHAIQMQRCTLRSTSFIADRLHIKWLRLDDFNGPRKLAHNTSYIYYT